MRIYNIDNADMNKRFVRALLAGIPASIVLGIAYGAIASRLSIEFSICFLLLGYAVGMVVQKTGRGVTQKFRILGAALGLLTIIVGDIVAFAGLSGIPALIAEPENIGTMLSFLASYRLSANVNTLLGTVFRIAAVYAAYNYSVIF